MSLPIALQLPTCFVSSCMLLHGWTLDNFGWSLWSPWINLQSDSESESEEFRHRHHRATQVTSSSSSDSCLDDGEKEVVAQTVDYQAEEQRVDHQTEDHRHHTEDHQTQTGDHQTDQQHPHQHAKKPCHRGRRFIGPAWKRASLAVQWEIGQSTMSKRFVERSVFGKKKSKGGNARRQRKLQQDWQWQW